MTVVHTYFYIQALKIKSDNTVVPNAPRLPKKALLVGRFLGFAHLSW